MKTKWRTVFFVKNIVTLLLTVMIGGGVSGCIIAAGVLRSSPSLIALGMLWLAALGIFVGGIGILTIFTSRHYDLLLGALLLVIAIAILELALRSREKPQITSELYINHPVMGYANAPDQEFCFPPRGDGIGHCYQTDSEGIFVRQHDNPAAEQVIMIFGDSLLEATDVDAEANISIQLEHAFKEQVRTVNLGISGYAPVQYWIAYNYFKPMFDPAVVIVFFTVGSDFTDDARLYHDDRIIFDRDGTPLAVKPTYDYENWRYWTSSDLTTPLPGALLWNSEVLGYFLRAERTLTGDLRQWLYNVNRNRIEACQDVSGKLTPRCANSDIRGESLLRNNFAVVFSDTYHAADWEDINRTLGYLRGMARQVEADGKAFLLVLLPDAVQIPGQMMAWRLENNVPADFVETDYPQQVINAYCEREQLTCLDLLPLIQVHQDEQIFWSDDVHLTEWGHRLVAEYIAQVLAAQNLIFAGY